MIQGDAFSVVVKDFSPADLMACACVNKLWHDHVYGRPCRAIWEKYYQEALEHGLVFRKPKKSRKRGRKGEKRISYLSTQEMVASIVKLPKHWNDHGAWLNHVDKAQLRAIVAVHFRPHFKISICKARQDKKEYARVKIHYCIKKGALYGDPNQRSAKTLSGTLIIEPLGYRFENSASTGLLFWPKSKFGFLDPLHLFWTTGSPTSAKSLQSLNISGFFPADIATFREY